MPESFESVRFDLLNHVYEAELTPNGWRVTPPNEPLLHRLNRIIDNTAAPMAVIVEKARELSSKLSGGEAGIDPVDLLPDAVKF